MKSLNYISILSMVILLLTGCKKEENNPEFAKDALPRIFGWSTSNIYTINIKDSLSVGLQVSPSDGATYQWFVDEKEVTSQLGFKHLFTSAKNYTLKFAVTRNGVTNSRQAQVIVIKPFVPKVYKKKMVGFITKDGSIDDIDFANLTHLVISSAVVGKVAGQASLVDTTFKGLDIPLIVKAAHNEGVYVMLDVTGNLVNINGSGLYADYGFFNVIADPTTQAEAITTVMKFAKDNNLDGINVYLNNTSEGSLNEGKVESFFRAIPASLPQGPSGKFFYTASVPGGWTTSVLKIIAKVEEIDWVNLQPFRYEDLAPTAHSPFWAFADLIATWQSFGLPKEKIVGGFPAVGLHYKMPKDGSVVGWGNLWMYTTYESYKSLLQVDATANTKNVLSVDDGIYYDGFPAVQQKAQYVVSQDLGGLMMWGLESDTRDPAKSLLKAANTALGN
jgi:hypothetical protein